MNKRISTIIIILLFASDVIVSKEMNYSIQHKINGVNYSPTLYDLSNNNKYFMSLSDYNWDKYICEAVDIESRYSVVSKQISKSIVPINISNDGHHAVCKYNNKVAYLDIDNATIVDSFNVTYGAYSDSLLIGHPIIGGVVNSKIIITINIYNKNVIAEYNIPEGYTSKDIFSLSKSGKVYISFFHNNSDNFLFYQDLKNKKSRIIKKDIDGYYELSAQGKYLLYTMPNNKIVIYDIENDKERYLSLSNFINNYYGSVISDDEKYIFLNIGDYISSENHYEVYNLESLELCKTIPSIFQYKSVNGKYSFWTGNESVIYGMTNQHIYCNVDIINAKQNSLMVNNMFSRISEISIILSKNNDFVGYISNYENIEIDLSNDTILSSSFANMNAAKEYYSSGYYFTSENTLYCFDYKTNKSTAIFNKLNNPLSICVLPDSNLIAVSCNDTINFINLTTKSIVNTLTTDYSSQVLNNIRVSDDKKYLYAGPGNEDNGDKILIKWDLNNLSNEPTYYYFKVTSPNKYFSSDNKYLLNNLIYREIFNTETELTESLEWFSSYEGEVEPFEFTDCGFSYDGKYIFATVNNYLYVWDYKTKKLIKTYRDQAEFNTMRISNVSKTLFVYKSDYTFEVLKYEDESGVFDIKSSDSGLKSYLLNNNSSLSIANDKLNPELCTYELYNASGELIIQNYTCSITDKNIEFKSMGLIPGAYFLNIRDKAQTKIYKIMIIGE